MPETIRFDHTNLCPAIPGGLRFNMTIIESGNEYLVAFRNRWKRSEIYAAWLDRDFVPTGRWRKIDLPEDRSTHGQEDPRWFRLGGQLYLSYIRFFGRSTAVLFARLNESTLDVERVYWPTMWPSNKYEKNHSYFDYQGVPHAVYTTNPHQIIKSPLTPEGEDPASTREYTTPFNGTWSGGEMRGGAAPVMHNGLWYHFFHGHVRSFDTGRRIYNCGLVCFRPEPPFNIVKYTPHPIDIADPSISPSDVKVDCIFPAGAVLVDGQWCISYGVCDKWCELRFYDAEEIEGKLVAHG